MAYTSSSSSSLDSKVSTCSKSCLKSYKTLKEHYDNLTKDFNKSQLNVGAYKAGLESIEARLDMYKKNEAVFEEDIKILKLDVMLRDNALTELRKKFKKAEKERDDLKYTLEKFKNSSKNLSKLLEIQVSDKFKTGVGYDSKVVDSQVFDSQVNDKYKIGEGYHADLPLYIGNFMPPKPNLVLADEEEYIFSESITSIPVVATSKVKTSESKPKSVSEPLIKDWISDSEDENDTEFKSKQRKPSFSKVEFVKSNEHVKIPREYVEKVENNKQAKYPRKNSQILENKEMNQFCEMKGIKREFSIARTLQQNRVAKRKNKALIEATRTMLVDSKLPTTFYVEAVNTACYIQNRVNLMGRLMRDSFVRYSVNSKAFRVFNSRTRTVEETLHITFLENKSNVAGSGPEWLFDIDTLTKFMIYEPVVAENQSNSIAGTKACENAGKARVETVPGKNYKLLPFFTQDPPFSSSLKDSPNAKFKPSREEEKKNVKHLEDKDNEVPNIKEPTVNQEHDESVNSTNNINTVRSTINTASIEDNAVDENIVYGCADDPNMPNLEEIVYSKDDEGVGTEPDMNNLDTFMLASPIPTTRIHKDHPFKQIFRDLHSAPQTRRMTKSVTEHESMQEELLQFKLQQVWTLVDLPYGKRAIGTKWVYKNKKDERVIVIKNKARLVAQGYTQEEGIDYDKVFAPVARIEAIKLFLAYASFKDFFVYQMDVRVHFCMARLKMKFTTVNLQVLKIQSSLTEFI
ncbi:putative ribonuclease H-like domain-containing protein, partial [Tanacetum coccineum]